MKGYLGEIIINIKDSKFAHYKIADWAKFWIENYSQIDGDHHKARILDQTLQILHKTPVIITLAKWKNGHEEYRFSLGKKSKSYLNFLKLYEEGIYAWYNGFDE